MDEEDLAQLKEWGLSYEEIKNKRLITKFEKLMAEFIEKKLGVKRLNEIREEIIWYVNNGEREETSKLMNYAEENEIDTNEKELIRLWNMGYEMDEIFEDGFLEKFHEIKDELEPKGRKGKKAEVDEETEELNTLHEIITEQGYEIGKADIRRLIKMGFDRYKLILDGVIEKYLENRDKDDKDIQRILMQLLEAKGYGKVLDRESDEFDESDESNETTEESETMKVFEEIIRIDLKMLGYDSLEDEELDKQILQWRIENTKECKKCEDEKLKKEFRIGREICIECEESQDEDSLRKSETSLEEEERSSDESEKLINTPGKSPSEHSDSEQEKEESKKSIIKTPIVPITPVKPKTMGATRNEVQTDLSTLLDTIYGQNLGLDWNNSAIPAITLTGLQGEIQNNTNAIGNLNTNRGTVVEIPIFYGTKGEDPEEWVNKFEETFTENGLGNDDAQKFRIAKAKLMGGASDWLKTEGVNITDWNTNGDHNLRLRARIIQKYASDDIKDKCISKFFGMQIPRDSVNFYRILGDLIFYGFLKNPLINLKDLLGFYKL
ncbi:hypothetical protein RhiirA4_474724 [Rhizophagus irregularis]|uniref:Uncharacterized protein n=1 Tax=Rhizophagus irregularis TaxID=588596 RepID=A0A2I1H8Z6_9GLOM|nr:hypothetical protein RhiirA4_474724 [Rhizophagus irregularis]